MTSQDKDAQALELVEKFLRRLRTDPGFAKAFHADPATAMQDEFPELRKFSKDQILARIGGAAGTAPGQVMVTGMLGAVAAAAVVVVANAFMAGAMRHEPPPE
jgi:hypothetical protein